MNRSIGGVVEAAVAADSDAQSPERGGVDATPPAPKSETELRMAAAQAGDFIGDCRRCGADKGHEGRCRLDDDGDAAETRRDGWCENDAVEGKGIDDAIP